MAAGIEIEIGKVRGPWPDVVIERVKKHYVMGIITAHSGPGLAVAPHAAEPEMLPGVWKLSPYAQKTAGGVKLIGVQAELFSKDFKRVDGAVRRWRFKLVINESSVGFFEVEGIAIVGDGYVTRTEELMKFFDEFPIILEVVLVSRIIRKGPNGYFAFSFPAVGKREDIPVL